ncbi:hypothetical protein ACFUEN_20400 [Streptomyces griseorubiginosus]|uniref:hypothetical protein n=1 Tax=Streptomyces griseorubiginosus TaxID=67304 RepID=UPI0036459DDD
MVLTAVINPLDGMLLRPHVEPARRIGCCRFDGLADAKLMCSRCGLEVGIEVSDCCAEFDIRLLLRKVVQDTSKPSVTWVHRRLAARARTTPGLA